MRLIYYCETATNQVDPAARQRQRTRGPKLIGPAPVINHAQDCRFVAVLNPCAKAERGEILNWSVKKKSQVSAREAVEQKERRFASAPPSASVCRRKPDSVQYQDAALRNATQDMDSSEHSVCR